MMAFIKDQYPITYSGDHEFTFQSDGPKGQFELLGRFSEVQPGIFNFGFGQLIDDDVTPHVLDDTVQLRNGDMDKIFNTCANQIVSFLKKNPYCMVAVRGSDTVRTRKYGQLLSKHYSVITSKYVIIGEKADGTVESFKANSPGYVLFLVRNK